ncbi:hypothetical protein F5B22DRAFT_589596 [Xylaria bambusicola]|uniref:uncharacterized protein n=1 Tax=Xylaria bambusicola TaxID=326684 RepID=UPI002007CD94|nr:uncharacterized protein F5B22DRAFT_589596 [Xylaria bambusicola]KAI0525366.1 hypothetical protein F5B22DRAFT_589596 [Xylaria bambusicola]
MELSRFSCLLGLLIPYSLALQVTPNSPCASFCIDSEGDDVSDPNSSTTTNKDITCYDSKYISSPVGQKFQRCISCLQDSTFSQGKETDQLWFFYNLRYTFDNCIFGFPHAVGIPSTPCSTSTACGALENALTQDGLNPNSLDYSFCDVDGGAITSSSLEKCASCVSASEDQGFLVNYLVALEAGCNQRPKAGTAIGLTDTVFAPTTISATKSSSKDAEDDQAAVPTATIVGIAVGASVVALLIAGLFFICYRKRRNRRLILEGGERSSSRRSHRRTTSPLSFRCQARTPRSPVFFPSQSHIQIEDEEKYCSNPSLALGSHRVTPEKVTSRTPPAHWQPRVTAPVQSRPLAARQSLHNISTAAPTVPDSVHHSTSPKAAWFSPHEETPVSTTSTGSTANLLPLRVYNPAEYGVSSPHIGSSIDGSYTSPTSASTASPLISRLWEKQNPDSMSPIWEVPQRETAILKPRAAGALERIRVPSSPGKRRVSNSGSPVESQQINMSFPGPPSPGVRWGRT